MITMEYGKPCSPCLDTSGCLYCPRSKDCGLCSFLKKVRVLFQGWLVLTYMVRTDTANHEELLSELAKLKLTVVLQDILVK